MVVHVGNQRLTYGVGDFEQDVAVAIRAHQLPDRQAVFQGKASRMWRRRRVKVIELALQLDEVLAVDQVLDQVVVRTFLAVGQVSTTRWRCSNSITWARRSCRLSCAFLLLLRS